MPVMTNITLNDGTNDVVVEPAYREGTTAVFEEDGAALNNRKRLTCFVRPDANNYKTRLTRVNMRVPVLVNAETGEVAYVRATLEVNGDKRINNSDFGAARALIASAVGNASVAEMIDDHRIFFG